MSGFDVTASELSAYAQKLSGQGDTANQISDLVGKADVGDKSWGVVGLFVKDEYTQMLGDLEDLFADLKNGFQSAEAKFTKAAEGYQQYEDSVKGLLDGIKIEIEG